MNIKMTFPATVTEYFNHAQHNSIFCKHLTGSERQECDQITVHPPIVEPVPRTVIWTFKMHLACHDIRLHPLRENSPLYNPPSTLIVVPLMKLALSEPRKAITLASSSVASHGYFASKFLNVLFEWNTSLLGTGCADLLLACSKNVPGGNIVDQDTILCILVRKNLRKSQNAGANGRRDDEVVDRLLGSYRGDVDDPAPLLLCMSGTTSRMHRIVLMRLRVMPSFQAAS